MIAMQIVVVVLLVVSATFVGYSIGKQEVYDDIDWRMDLMDQAMEEWEDE